MIIVPLVEPLYKYKRPPTCRQGTQFGRGSFVGDRVVQVGVRDELQFADSTIQLPVNKNPRDLYR